MLEVNDPTVDCEMKVCEEIITANALLLKVVRGVKDSLCNFAITALLF